MWNSNADHMGEMSIVPPPQHVCLRECENEWAVERAAEVAVFFGGIQVSVRARK